MSEADHEEANESVDVGELLNIRLRSAVAEASDWAREARRAWQYYQSHQWQNMTERERHRVIPIVANVIRRDLDQMVAQVLESEPVVNVRGRHERDYEVGRLLVDLLQWTRDEERNWLADLETVITDCFHTGEGIMHEYWDQDAHNGMGMPRAIAWDPRFIVWDPVAKDEQKTDAEWVITFEPRKVAYLEKKWADELGNEKIQSDYPDFFVGQAELAQFNEYTYGQGDDDSYMPDEEPQAYEKIMYEKIKIFEKRYVDPDGQVVMLPNEAGELEPMTDEQYKELDADQKKSIDPIKSERTELWQTTVINQTVVDSRLSIYDESRGGHGEYPFCWFSYVHVRDRSHAKGEVDYLVGMQDLINRSLARWLEQLMIAGSNFIISPKGSLPKEDEEKLHNVGRNPMQVFRPYPGFEGPKVDGGNPTGASLFSSGFGLLGQIKDQISGVYDVNRGEMPYQTSGRGIRALQSAVDVLGTMPKKHIESGLRQATMLRMSNLLQFCRGSRMAEVSDTKTRDNRRIYVGRSLSEIQVEFGLPVLVDQQSGREVRDPETGAPLALMDPRLNQAAYTVVLNNDTAGVVNLKRIKLELDTGKERTKQERMEFAEIVLNRLGAPAVPWAMELLDAPNQDQLLEAIRSADGAQRLLMQIEELAKSSGMQPEQILQFMQSQVANAMQGPQQGPQQGAPQGPPQGPPQGAPAAGPAGPGGPPAPQPAPGP